jgi:hypothetical protein
MICKAAELRYQKEIKAHFFYMKEAVGLPFLVVGVSSDDY